MRTARRGRTRTSSYPSKNIRDMVLITGMEKGAALSDDRLDEVSMQLATHFHHVVRQPAQP